MRTRAETYATAWEGQPPDRHPLPRQALIDAHIAGQQGDHGQSPTSATAAAEAYADERYRRGDSSWAACAAAHVSGQGVLADGQHRLQGFLSSAGSGGFTPWQPPSRGLSHPFIHPPQSMSGKTDKPWLHDPKFTGCLACGSDDYETEQGGNGEPDYANGNKQCNDCGNQWV